jgi:hypothetical protein
MIMKELKNKWIRVFIFLFAITAAFSSCTKDENVAENADYVGKWSSEATDPSSSQGSYIQVLTLTKNTFDAMVKTKNGQGEWVNTFALKGNMTVSGNKMNIHISEFGTSINPITGETTNTFTYYKEGSMLFDPIMSSSGREQDYQSEYVVSGNTLTLKTDMNNDKDYTDAEETMVYTRQ